MIRRLAAAAFEDACNAIAWAYVSPWFWLARLTDPTVCNWRDVGRGER